ncbi:BEM_HP_G0089580.mRNA.1.CDS.1 [Saccharomyces cerevisiae]|nr:BEM_HP_G0149850.mRNA.1.CDS.1 [Saccharomyces cerevisiae]CAI5180784.1 BEM_HP_G0089580.mRNA.1.CDS.1 [Saccharomyces cerevisiae]CAI6665306.1 BEM_HP_G0149850.mRNA.1.CDS.1 [Saccharomyces cerevisiae]CAI7000589.1 BEM_HP_G0089580.mRNA.1.CDS.1 [Saccharomyces cerevisiae]
MMLEPSPPPLTTTVTPSLPSSLKKSVTDNNQNNNNVPRKRKLACQNCRRRRRKCNMEKPCSNCIKFRTECVFPQQDLRNKRYSTTYVEALQSQIRSLKEQLQILSSSSSTIASNALSSLKNNSDHGDAPNEKILKYGETAQSALPSSESNDENESNAFTKKMPSESPPPVGTNSIYPSNSLSIIKKKTDGSTRYQQQQVSLKNLSRSPLILRSLSLFFKWLYPGHYLFIHRETFLSAFFGDTNTKSYYCSEELVFAIAALGSLISYKSETELFQQSEVFYQRAKTIVLKKIFQLEDSSLAESSSSSKLAIIQTLLCLAFYDIGSGENPMAWYLSGLAFRIAHEIGLHLNPEAWSNVYEDELSIMDFEVRSRIYWGCYIADHLIAILFGRSTSLRLSNSTVPETDELPEIETGIEEYIYDPKVILSTANPLKKLIVLSRITEIFASKIFSPNETLLQRSEYLAKFNLEVYNWRRDLPPELQWTKRSLMEMTDFNPTIAYVWFHYYIVLISYNKPFIYEIKQSRELVEGYVDELYYLLKVWKNKFKTFEKTTIYMIYSAILAIQCMKSNLIKKDRKQDFLNFLSAPTLNYELARKFIENSEDALHNSETMDLLGTLSHGNDFALEYNFDFTLLNEIDMLIGGNTNDGLSK